MLERTHTYVRMYACSLNMYVDVRDSHLVFLFCSIVCGDDVQTSNSIIVQLIAIYGYSEMDFIKNLLEHFL